MLRAVVVSWFHSRPSSLHRQLYVYFCPHLTVRSFFKPVEPSFSMPGDPSAFNLISSFFLIYHSGNYLDLCFPSYQELSCLCLLFSSPASDPTHLFIFYFLNSCQKLWAILSLPQSFLLTLSYMFCFYFLVNYILLYVSVVHKSPKEFSKHWGWLNESQEPSE